MRILLVDDETEFISTLAERLSLRGVDADWVNTAEAAIEKVDEQNYDLIVLDVKMPRVSGIELKRILQKRRPDLQFIFMTGHGSEQDFRTGSKEAGVAFYLVKPVNIDELMCRMSEALHKEGNR